MKPVSVVEKDESLLITALQSGDKRAFRVLYEQLHPAVYRFIYALLKDQSHSEEILQETFIKLWANRHKLDSQQPLYPYLYLIARRLSIDAFRKVITENKLKEHLQYVVNDVSNHTEEQLLLHDLRQCIDAGMKQLPHQQRLVFQLNRLEGLSYDEIAKNLKISRNTVRNHLVSALKTMKIFISKNDITIFFLFFFLLH
ncbi:MULTISPECIES: RNA polymerase sigma factor [Olivibacter]|jgi:RNA polymerase sigma-70 factor (ECF subfamily)|uniref:RNA polymerase sigma factor n=1 Tax=Olivibacter oleidegradans TaxID=760123 RepID=A0ABV6HMS7_9SPHI|nr:RNA polymerase sigma-70 factor [Olivibacter jilunii]